MENKKVTKLKAGDNHYKAFVGPPQKYDLIGAMQFNLLTNFGLRDYHKLLDIGCGSLRLGRLMIPYLQKGNYYGTEPNKWLIEEGLKNELGNEIVSVKSPAFNYSPDFDLQVFNEKFDYLIAQSIFSHASSQQISKCLSEAKIVLKNDGLFLATFVLGKDNYLGNEWSYPQCVRYKHKYILKLARQQGLDVIRTAWIHPNSQTWYVIFHTGNRNKVKAIIRTLFTRNRTRINIIKFLKKAWLRDKKLVNR